MDNMMHFEAIGYIKTKYIEREDTPSQGQNSTDSHGTIIIREEFIEGIQGFKPGDKITVIFNFHKSTGFKLTIVPYRQDTPIGVFCTRSPDRPNGVGITIVEIIKVDKANIEFIGADMLDGTPIIDIKPCLF